jgi:hypothetical protein
MKPSCEKVLDLLRDRPRSTADFAESYAPRAAARMCELRKMGYVIESRQVANNSFVYSLISEPPGLPIGGATPTVSPDREIVAVDREASGSDFPSSIEGTKSEPAFSIPPEEAQATAGTLFDLIDIDIPPASPYATEAA